MPTTIRRAVLSLPAAPLGPENPLPALLPPFRPHRPDAAQRAALPAAMARQVGYAPLRTVLPVRRRDGYARERVPTDVEALILENDRLRATVLPGLGGRVHSLEHKPTGRQLLYRNPVLQPAEFGLNGAWFSGGIEWNTGATGHSPLATAPVHAARVPAPGGGEMLRLWEWERMRDLPFQVDLWLPDGSDFLHVGVRIRNPHERPAPVYWWSNIAVPEAAGTRVLAPADEAWRFGYERTLRRVPVPEWEGADRTYPLRSTHAADFFYDVPDGGRRWIASLDAEGSGLVQTSTDLLRGRKLFVWGSGPGGRRWQEWLTEPGTDGYAEIQAGLARTQLEHVRLEAGGEFSWLEAYGPLTADAGRVHGADWAAARDEAGARLEAALPRAAVAEAYEAWRPYADLDPKESLATGSGWGALEVERGRYELPGTPFDAGTLGEEQEPWLALLRSGSLPVPARALPPEPTLVSPHWRDLLELAETGDDLQDHHLHYHLGVARWHAGDRSQAVRSWEQTGGGHWPSTRCLAVADQADGHPERAADRFLQAYEGARARHGDGVSWTAAMAALGREAAEALLAVGRADDAGAVLDGLRPAVLARGRFTLLRARVLLARGDAAGARALFDEGFEVDDLREGDETLADTWYAVAERLLADGGPVTETIRSRARAEHPLPRRYDFRMRPARLPEG
ncbi:hypothetical protein AF335_19025 [Streptomyces eurocidicus]|uniref:DUF5107 domain-containing protein n=1 Tax=Streptomyces eurocidicus TaxID=66423 RepID=A0A2N8NV75_STREU|nr:DUF5107 domain-containing protein [Streptomyces eurocidicus]MBB5122455.1 hypothetical protein [Streptomyces eurocidicus]MBF6052138.1 DUF5107 domain-containing protein [Streptomyces eurocidicus]PNE32622.1 hypothetical protein AF335_19025 [Streptomyces eurocidicus]